jgi:hypothetical protein
MTVAKLARQGIYDRSRKRIAGGKITLKPQQLGRRKPSMQCEQERKSRYSGMELGEYRQDWRTLQVHFQRFPFTPRQTLIGKKFHIKLHLENPLNGYLR